MRLPPRPLPGSTPLWMEATACMKSPHKFSLCRMVAILRTRLLIHLYSLKLSYNEYTNSSELNTQKRQNKIQSEKYTGDHEMAVGL